MKNASPGANCAMSETGWSNSEIFRKYLKEHFLKCIPRREPDEHLLLLLDGHKSHISIDLVEWAKTQNIILFALPAHTSHVLQPMDVACYGPFQKMFNNFCHKHTRQTSSSVTRYDICGLACTTCNKALSCDNLISAFNKTGIYPLDRSAISEISGLSAEDTQNNITDVLSVPENQDIENDLNQNVNENNNELEIHNDDSTPISVISPSAFMEEKLKKLKTVKGEKKSTVRNTVGKIVSGKPITESNVQKKLVDHQCTQTKSATKSTVTKRLKLNRIKVKVKEMSVRKRNQSMLMTFHLHNSLVLQVFTYLLHLIHLMMKLRKMTSAVYALYLHRRRLERASH